MGDGWRTCWLVGSAGVRAGRADRCAIVAVCGRGRSRRGGGGGPGRGWRAGGAWGGRLPVARAAEADGPGSVRSAAGFLHHELFAAAWAASRRRSWRGGAAPAGAGGFALGRVDLECRRARGVTRSRAVGRKGRSAPLARVARGAGRGETLHRLRWLAPADGDRLAVHAAAAAGLPDGARGLAWLLARDWTQAEDAIGKALASSASGVALLPRAARRAARRMPRRWRTRAIVRASRGGRTHAETTRGCGEIVCASIARPTP